VADGVDHRADVYALGITLYELLCGIPPFIGRGIGDVMMLHMGVAPEPPSRRRSDVPAEIDAIVLKALEKAPEARFQSMSEMAEALRSSLGGERPVRPSPSRPVPPALFRPSPRNSTPSNLSVSSPAPKASGWSRRTTLIALGSLVLVGLGGQAVLRQNGSRPMSALDNDSTEQQSLRLRGEAGAAASGAAPVATSDPLIPARAPSASASASPPPPVVRSAPVAVTPAAVATAAATSALSAGQTEPALTAAEGSGFLSLDSVPWANVYVGGRMLGTTPLDRVPLPAGRQVLRLENPELEASTEYVVQLDSGRLVSRFVDWDAKRQAPSSTP
jgi:serine/threonine-protein kinase